MSTSKATLAALWEQAHDATPPDKLPAVALDTGTPTPPGYAAWRLWKVPQALTVVLPALVEHPNTIPGMTAARWASVIRRYMINVVCRATGECPMCHHAVTVAPPAPDEFGWYVDQVKLVSHHAGGCPAVFEESERIFFQPFTTTEEP